MFTDIYPPVEGGIRDVALDGFLADVAAGLSMRETRHTAASAADVLQYMANTFAAGLIAAAGGTGRRRVEGRYLDVTAIAYDRWWAGWQDWVSGNVAWHHRDTSGAIPAHIAWNSSPYDDDGCTPDKEAAAAMASLISAGKLAGFYAWLEEDASTDKPLVYGEWLDYVAVLVQQHCSADEVEAARAAAHNLRVARWRAAFNPVEAAHSFAMMIVEAIAAGLDGAAVQVYQLACKGRGCRPAHAPDTRGTLHIAGKLICAGCYGDSLDALQAAQEDASQIMFDGMLHRRAGKSFIALADASTAVEVEDNVF